MNDNTGKSQHVPFSDHEPSFPRIRWTHSQPWHCMISTPYLSRSLLFSLWESSMRLSLRHIEETPSAQLALKIIRKIRQSGNSNLCEKVLTRRYKPWPIQRQRSRGCSGPLQSHQSRIWTYSANMWRGKWTVHCLGPPPIEIFTHGQLILKRHQISGESFSSLKT